MIIYGKRYLCAVYFLYSSDVDLIFQFEEYVSAALSTVKYRAFIEKGDNNGIMITGGSGMLSFVPFLVS